MGESHIVAVLEGETVLSEVFSILAFRTIIEMQINTVDGLLLIEGFWSFLRFLVVSVCIGVVMGVLASLLIKYIHNRESDVNYPVVALFFIIPIISYMIAEGLHVSASITIRICGFILSYYTQYSLSTITYPWKRLVWVLHSTREYTTHLVEVIGTLAEHLSYFIVGIISYIVQPFDMDYRLLLVCVVVMFICRYASVTGVLASVIRYVEPTKRFLDHNYVELSRCANR